MFERHWELKCVVRGVKHLAYWFLGFHGWHSELLPYRSQRWICQQLHLNLATQCHIHSVTIGVLRIGHIQTFRCELPKGVAFKIFLWQHKSEIPFLIVPIYIQNLWQSINHHLCTLQGLWSMSLCMYTTCEITAGFTFVSDVRWTCKIPHTLMIKNYSWFSIWRNLMAGQRFDVECST